MFSVIANIYNKKAKGPILMELFTTTGKLKKFFSFPVAVNSYTERLIMFSVITNIYNKKTKGPILMELFTATGKLKKFFRFPVTVNSFIKVGPLVFLL
jgi:hypothetical protein